MKRRVSGWLGQLGRPSSHPQLVEGRYDSTRAIAISNAQQLLTLQPSCVDLLDQQFHVQSLVGRLCPVLLDDGSVALFALAEHVGSDQADELSRRIEQQGYKLASPSRYILAAPLLLALGRRQLLLSPGLSSDPATANDAVEHSSTALADAFQGLVEWGVRHHASDLHINLCQGEAVSEVRYTVAGRYVAPECFRGMPTSMLADMLAVIWMDIRGGNGAVFDPQSEQQGSMVKMVDGQRVMLRWASLAAERGASVCLRLLVRAANTLAPDLLALGYLPDQVSQIQRALMAEGGAVVFAGTVGSGKSTTLASLISRLPDHRKVITLEDPVEYLIPGAIQNTVVRALNTVAAHDDYAAKLRALKRSAMSDVLLGEVRDAETGLAFMDLAGSGVNIYTTVHAPSAALVAERLASDFIGVSRDFLATPGVLKLLVFQALLPVLCTRCALPASSLLEGADRGQWQSWLDTIAAVYGDTSGLKIRNPKGCVACHQPQLVPLAGYAGRTVAAEILEPGLRPGYLSSVQNRCVPQWLASQQQALYFPAAMEGTHRLAMDSAMMKAFDGLLDPRDIESRFQSFQTLHLQQQVKHKPNRLRVIS